MAEIRTLRTARKRHRCGSKTSRCHRTIQPGDRYLLASMPPRGELGYENWLNLKVCQGCAEVYGQPMEEQVTPRRSATTAPMVGEQEG